jgi:Tfp pilus assembly protein PilF
VFWQVDNEMAVTDRPGWKVVILGSLLACAAATVHAQIDSKSQDLDRQFQSAAADYDAGKYPEAEKKLQVLLPYAGKSYEFHELLGLVYAELGENDKAVAQLQLAVRLKPGASTAHTNLAAALFHSGQTQLASEQFHRALELAPNDYDANHNLGEFYVESGKIAEA